MPDCSPDSAARHALDVPRCGDLLVELDLDVVGERRRRRHEDGRGHRVVLGLAEQVRGDERRGRGVVGQDRDLGRTCLGVDAHGPLEQPLRRDRVDVAGAGDEVDLAARTGAVGEHRDRLGAPDGVHLVDAEQRARGEDRRVRQPAVVGLGSRGQRDGVDARDLRGHDVHHHARDQRCDPAGDVETDPLDRHHPPADRAPGHDLRPHVVLELGLTGLAEPTNRLLEPGPDGRVERRQAADIAAGRTVMSDCSTPSKRAVASVTASTPRWRTSSQIGRTTSSAASTSKAARGTTSR